MDDPRIELGDPTTSPQRLFEIAHTHPEFGMLIAAHPNAYPELRQWVAAVAAQQVQRASSLSEAAAPASRLRSNEGAHDGCAGNGPYGANRW